MKGKKLKSGEIENALNRFLKDEQHLVLGFKKDESRISGSKNISRQNYREISKNLHFIENFSKLSITQNRLHPLKRNSFFKISESVCPWSRFCPIRFL